MPSWFHRFQRVVSRGGDRKAGPPDSAAPQPPGAPQSWLRAVTLTIPHDSSDDRPGRASSRAQEDRALFERYLDRRDPVDREALVERFLPLARQLARRYQRPEEPFDDLLQVASLGLVKAIDRFDLEREVAFSSYAVPTILGEIKRYFRDRTWSVRVPRDLQELALKVDRAVGQLSVDLHRQPSVQEIARAVESHRGGRARGARGVGRLPRHVAASPRAAPTTTRATRSATRSAPTSAASPSRRTAPRSPRCCAPSRRASARCCACASRRTSRRRRSASASASRRCRSRASSASRSARLRTVARTDNPTP